MPTASGCVDISIGSAIGGGSLNANAAFSGAATAVGWAPNINLPSTVIPSSAWTYAGAATNPGAYGRQLLNQYGKQYGDQYGAYYATDISQAAVYLNSQAARDVFAGAQAAADGKPLTKQQIQAGFVTAATVGTAVAVSATTGVAITAAIATASVVFAPIALVVFGGGALIDAGMRAIFGPDSSPRACSPQDTSLRGKDPSDPNWRPYSSGQEEWLPISDGAFERWARPIVLAVIEKQLNCLTVPGINKPGDECAFYAGLVAVWNSMFPGAPRRTIDVAGLMLAKFGNLKYSSGPTGSPDGLVKIADTRWSQSNFVPKDPDWRLQWRYANDPIAQMALVLWGCPAMTGRSFAQAPLVNDSDFTRSILSRYLPLSVAAPLTTMQKILRIAVPVAAAPFAYAWYAGKPVESVLRGAWRSTVSVFR